MKEFTVEWTELLKETRQATFKAASKKEAIQVVKDLKVSGDSIDYIEFYKIVNGSIKVIKKVK